MKENGLLTYMNLEDMYYDHVMASFDIPAIRNSTFTIGYDAMYGAGYLIFPRILPQGHMPALRLQSFVLWTGTRTDRAQSETICGDDQSGSEDADWHCQ